MRVIETTIRPYSYREQEIAVGSIVSGEFQQDRSLWNVTKDRRLNVSRKFSGKGAATDVTYRIEVPANYPLTIAVKEKQGQHLTRACFVFDEILFQPLPAKKDAVLCFGKHAGKKFSEVPASYLRWIASHSKVLREGDNRKFAKLAEDFLAK